MPNEPDHDVPDAIHVTLGRDGVASRPGAGGDLGEWRNREGRWEGRLYGDRTWAAFSSRRALRAYFAGAVGGTRADE